MAKDDVFLGPVFKAEIEDCLKFLLPPSQVYTIGLFSLYCFILFYFFSLELRLLYQIEKLRRCR